MKKYILAGLTAIFIALPASAALASDSKVDDLTGAIQQGQSNSVSADVKNEIGSTENEQAGEVDQHGESDQVNEDTTDSGGTDGTSGADGQSVESGG